MTPYTWSKLLRAPPKDMYKYMLSLISRVLSRFRVKNANFKSGADGYFFSKNKCQLKLHGNMRRQSASF